MGSARREAEEDTVRPENDGERSKAVEARVDTVGDECSGNRSSDDSDAVNRDNLVAGEPMIPPRRAARVLDRARVDEPVDRLPAGDDRGERNDEHDEHARQVFRTAIPVGVPLVGDAAPEDERDPQRHGGERVGEVVDGVGQKRDRSRERGRSRPAARSLPAG